MAGSVRSTRHPACTLPLGGWCCIHGDCKGWACCYHGSAEEPHSMDYQCGKCGGRFPRAEYLTPHVRNCVGVRPEPEPFKPVYY